MRPVTKLRSIDIIRVFPAAGFAGETTTGTEDEMKSAKSIVSFFSIRSTIGVATAFVVVLAASLAQAAPLTAVPPGFLSPVPAEADPGAAAQIATRSENFNGLGFSGVLVSNVYRGNQFGANALTFTYLLQ